MNRFSIVLFTAALAVTHFLQAQNPLPVALESQEASQWCWAASGAMIMKYRGRSVSQCEQACRRLHLKDCCQRRTGDCNKSGWPQFKAYGFTCKTTSDRELSEKQIEDQINNRKPVAFSWHLLDETGRDEGRGHMMVIIGYKILNGDLQ
jgi:Papain-like cysteine protease AvrRpt2